MGLNTISNNAFFTTVRPLFSSPCDELGGGGVGFSSRELILFLLT